jgi:hypothetical protein
MVAVTSSTSDAVGAGEGDRGARGSLAPRELADAARARRLQRDRGLAAPGPPRALARGDPHAPLRSRGARQMARPPSCGPSQRTQNSRCGPHNGLVRVPRTRRRRRVPTFLMRAGRRERGAPRRRRSVGCPVELCDQRPLMPTERVDSRGAAKADVRDRCRRPGTRRPTAPHHALTSVCPLPWPFVLATCGIVTGRVAQAEACVAPRGRPPRLDQRQQP